MNELEWLFTLVAITELSCFMWFLYTLIVELRKFLSQNQQYQSNNLVITSPITALIDNNKSSIQNNNKYGDHSNSEHLPQSLSIISQNEEEISSKRGQISHRSDTSHTSGGNNNDVYIESNNKISKGSGCFKCRINQNIYCIFQILMVSITTFLSTLMMFNKVWYKCFNENVLFVNSNNFNYLNNIYKTLSIISLCYLWNVSRCNNGVQNGLLRVMCKSKWYSFDRQYFLIMFGWLLSYNLAYDFFVKKQKWNDKWTHILANLFDDVFICIVIPLALSIDFNLKKKYEKNNMKNKWILYVELYLLNVLLSNVIIVVKYNILVFLIESTTLSQGMSVSRSTAWSIYGFYNNYLMGQLIKMFAYKIIFHHRKVRPPKCEDIQ